MGGVIGNLAVLSEYRNRGILTLLNKAIDILKNKGIKRLEAWTRDDKCVSLCKYILNELGDIDSKNYQVISDLERS